MRWQKTSSAYSRVNCFICKNLSPMEHFKQELVNYLEYYNSQQN